MVFDLEECHNCDGWGTIANPDACGDPDHCSPQVICPVCRGKGKVAY